MSAQVGTMHDVIAGRHQVTNRYGKPLKTLIHKSTLKPSDTHRNLHTRNDNISHLFTTPKLSQNEYTCQI